ncbi:MAG: hypothetical protein E5X53_28215 [Mesorhizobium sp.]|uniref:hypothetical protein n=1 Tax=Mesorhizobium sp. TaxID=1871066 RepID=UPI00122A2686|nr:hypothetical protein [Mesorhizobium sp.]TIP70349.1 MAG: hypothetical protein E5X55_27935 [Mesorhizobium sp.]TIQ06746.1 MAG: hypothetical protein E5X57_24155 [Mesorhizobium sp.]TIR48613.1 MAG: hypothetical protein E5X53_28215 [Mesorhizobium sp.]TJV94698.1 MAG: hypothetical protein E5X52_27920 [Mesorhizobium sp.]
MKLFRHRANLDMTMIDAIATMEIDADPGILNSSANVIDSVLADARSDRLRLEDEITDRQEQLRQTIVVIEAFETAAKHLDNGYDRPAVTLSAAAE